ncbi:hypothetical protein BGZ47_005041, partial [Haplosporangium gracile]
MAVDQPFLLTVYNNDLFQHHFWALTESLRRCVCLSNAQTYKIKTYTNPGWPSDVKLSTDCMGSYGIMGGNDAIDDS